MQTHTPLGLAAARKLRREMSLPEGLLWHHLRQRPMGVKFRKQHPIGNCVVDFYCAAPRLVIEIDGIAHDMGDRPDRDAGRDTWLRSLGYEVVRIAARDVLQNPDLVAESLVALCLDRPPPSALRADTSPIGGGSIGASC